MKPRELTTFEQAALRVRHEAAIAAVKTPNLMIVGS
jgi:hypothetical protein